MVAIKCLITKFIDEHQPGFVECKLNDAWNKQHIFHEKVPIVTIENIWNNTTYPVNGVIGCEITREWIDENGRRIVTVTTSAPWGIETIEGIIELDVLRSQIINIE